MSSNQRLEDLFEKLRIVNARAQKAQNKDNLNRRLDELAERVVAGHGQVNARNWVKPELMVTLRVSKRLGTDGNNQHAGGVAFAGKRTS